MKSASLAISRLVQLLTQVRDQVGQFLQDGQHNDGGSPDIAVDVANIRTLLDYLAQNDLTPDAEHLRTRWLELQGELDINHTAQAGTELLASLGIQGVIESDRTALFGVAEKFLVRLDELIVAVNCTPPSAHKNASGTRRKVNWQQTASHLETLRRKGEPFKTQAAYAEALDCSISTINKAIEKTPSLKEWAARPASSASSAVSVEGAVLDSTPQQRESNPADALEQADVDFAMRYLMEQASPEERAEINAMSPDQRRMLAETAYRDPDHSEAILKTARSPHSR